MKFENINCCLCSETLGYIDQMTYEAITDLDIVCPNCFEAKKDRG